ncbi:O-antigen ligase family protein [uncultured Erythrobacter sp.]|uniref:O-antigen ligase family protein n=1 Tax=uncultured Erythrobacter sp. TaxID=263913 RepID=UPI002614962C|nr:O-antigen ligase family protein [uncultured Erythrobacter sp.]
MSAQTRKLGSSNSSAPTSGFLRPRPLLATCALLIVAFVFGGGGVRYGLANLLVQITALGILALHRDAFLTFWKNSPLPLRILTALSLLLPALFLIPLPQAVWGGLPGRDLVAQSLEAIGSGGWRAASVDPARTLVALTGLIVPLTVLAVGWTIPRRHLMTVGWLIVALGLACFALGVLQVLSGGNSAVIFAERGPTGLLYGTFANRNSTGVFLVGALTLAALLPLPLARPHPAGLPVRLGICALLLLAVVLTRSRTAFVLAAIPIALGLARAFWAWRGARSGGGSGRGSLAVFGGIALAVIAIGSVVAIAPGRIGETIERFEATDDARVYIWEDAAYSADRFWPVGAGMGTFDEVFQVDESLEFLTKRRAGRAHNDYLELAIEAGIPGLGIAAGWLLLVGWLSWKAGRSQFCWPAWGCGALLLAVALQSITDYPLRNQTMLAVAAFALLLLARVASAPDREPTR